MSNITGEEIVKLARRQLHDISGRRYTDDDMLMWLNEAQQLLTTLKPTALIETSIEPLIPGHEQHLPCRARMLVDMGPNMGMDLNSPGRVPSRTTLDVMNRSKAVWPGDTSSLVVYNYAYESTDPLIFYVYPPQGYSAPGSIQLRYSVIPEDIDDLADTLELSIEYRQPLADYLISKALDSDSDSPANMAAGASYMRKFMFTIGAATTAETPSQGG